MLAKMYMFKHSSFKSCFWVRVELGDKVIIEQASTAIKMVLIYRAVRSMLTKMGFDVDSIGDIQLANVLPRDKPDLTDPDLCCWN